VGTNFDVLDASANLTAAETTLTGAKADYLTALSALYAAMGELKPDLGLTGK
jgi:outer membrane protein